VGNTLDLDTGDLDRLIRDQAGAVARLDRALEPAQLGPVGDTLGDAVRDAWRGPYAGVLAAATKVVTSPDLAVTTGGSGGHLSGGAGPGDLVLGVEFGGGRRVGQVRSSRRAKAHRRRTTMQFRGQSLAATRAVEGHLDDAAQQLGDAVEEAVTSA
jgi:hypothetical protein